MKNYHDIIISIITLGMLADFVTTPEQREEWAKESDWRYHASKFTD